MMKKLGLKALLRCQNGVVAIEAALILPLLILMYFGMWDVTHYISENRKVTSIAGTVADLVGQHRRFVVHTATTGDLQDYFRVAAMVMKPDTDSGIRIRVASYRPVLAGTVTTPTLVWSVNNGKGLNCTKNPTNAELLSLMGAGKDVVVTQVCTKVQFYYSHILGPIFKQTGATASKQTSKTAVEQYVMISPRISNTMDCYANATSAPGASTCGTTG
jgi:Flp pilus assembly protein TadG